MSAAANPQVVLTTERGEIVIEVFIDEAPIGSRNFLAYVDQGLWSEATFYRTMRDEHWTPGRELSLVQGGLGGAQEKALPPIPHESGDVTGLLHLRGAVSYARAAPGTAGTEFFICVEDCPTLDPTPNPTPPADGLGYAVFGQVVHGMHVVAQIHQAATSMDAPIDLLRGQMLSPPIPIQNVRRLMPIG